MYLMDRWIRHLVQNTIGQTGSGHEEIDSLFEVACHSERARRSTTLNPRIISYNFIKVQTSCSPVPSFCVCVIRQVKYQSASRVGLPWEGHLVRMATVIVLSPGEWHWTWTIRMPMFIEIHNLYPDKDWKLCKKPTLPCRTSQLKKYLAQSCGNSLWKVRLFENGVPLGAGQRILCFRCVCYRSCTYCKGMFYPCSYLIHPRWNASRQRCHRHPCHPVWYSDPRSCPVPFRPELSLWTQVFTWKLSGLLVCSNISGIKAVTMVSHRAHLCSHPSPPRTPPRHLPLVVANWLG